MNSVYTNLNQSALDSDLMSFRICVYFLCVFALRSITFPQSAGKKKIQFDLRNVSILFLCFDVLSFSLTPGRPIENK